MTRLTKMWCDLCGKESHPQYMTCMVQYVKWSMFKKKSAEPQGVQVDVCRDCQDLIVKAVENIKNEVQTKKGKEAGGVSEDS